MTEIGNHGGSSYEETDSLALFIGLQNTTVSTTTNTINQVDVTSTLALLFGVPIPKNNAGHLIAEVFHSLTDDQQLRAFELNSWQLLRILQAQTPESVCQRIYCNVNQNGHWSGTSPYSSTKEEELSCLYLDAEALHKSLKTNKASRSNSSEDYLKTIVAYNKFVATASEWLSHRATDKPFGLIASGIIAMLLSCFLLLGLLFQLSQEEYPTKEPHLPDVSIHMWRLPEKFTVAILLILILSMGSSSMVEEEQYIWHFMTSTLYLVLLLQKVQSISARPAQSSLSATDGHNNKTICIQMCYIAVILISGRVLRGWHQGGVNWTHLPDISKWLESARGDYIKSIQLLSAVLVIISIFFALYLQWSKSRMVKAIGLIFIFPALLVIQYIINCQDTGFAATDYSATAMAQMIYACLVVCTMATVLLSPWLISFQHLKDFTVVTKDCIYLIGWGYMFSWCLLQLLLQQPINSMPVFLLLVQILASIYCASVNGSHVKQWVEIAALYYLGMAGHYSFGNTNNLATIDVAGAFIGITNHSTLLSGILMFIITYASPMMALLSMVIYISVKDVSSLVNPRPGDVGRLLKRTLGFPCLIPLALNSALLMAYTIVLLLMRNHLFVWSVFSPKYLYVCANTACVCFGVFIVASSVAYSVFSVSLRRILQSSSLNSA